ncbi:MAG: hypothetical protein IJQ08_09885 [Synergistaceae bacterium]|nr:hypothetical protein [Synergistaceae bacterium]
MKRVTATLTTIILCSALLWGCAFAVLEENHECSGDDCPVCLCIALCEEIFCRLSFTRGTVYALCAVSFLLTLIISPSVNRVTPSTLITLKVKLSD